MRRPFTLDSRTYLQVINKQIQLFNDEWASYVEDEMYYLPETADLQTVTRAINDFDYLVHSLDPKEDDLLSDYLDIREQLVEFRMLLYAEMFNNDVFETE